MTDKKDGEIQKWIRSFRASCDRGGIAVSKDNETFRTAEMFFWIGIMAVAAVPQEIIEILTQHGSPLLDYKPKRMRGPRKKTDKAPPGEVFN